MARVELLTKILLDINARTDERDDAAIDLGKYDDDRALDALLSIAMDSSADPFVMDVCGESIAEIWVKRNYFDLELYKKMTPPARHELYRHVKATKPEWIKKFNIVN